MSEPTTVREVLEAHLREHFTAPEVEKWTAAILADLRTVLSTGEHYKTRRVPARDLLVGDVMAARDGRLWSVSSFPPPTDDTLEVVIVRGEDVRTMHFAPDREVPILLTAQDARALAILERELGATSIGREAA